MEIHAFQYKAFEDDSWRRFKREMVEHLQQFSPLLCSVVGEQQLQHIVELGVQRSEAYGFTCRGPIRLFLELVFVCGSAFDTDPQFHPISTPLREPGDQMLRAERIHEEHNSYLQSAAGKNPVDLRKALEELHTFDQSNLTLQAREFETLREAFKRMFSDKTAYAGDEAMDVLFGEAHAVSVHYGFTTSRQFFLVALLMGVSGHGCTNDPLYQWISGTLQDASIQSGAERATLIQANAVTWLDLTLTQTDARADV